MPGHNYPDGDTWHILVIIYIYIYHKCNHYRCDTANRANLQPQPRKKLINVQSIIAIFIYKELVVVSLFPREIHEHQWGQYLIGWRHVTWNPIDWEGLLNIYMIWWYNRFLKHFKKVVSENKLTFIHKPGDISFIDFGYSIILKFVCNLFVGPIGRSLCNSFISLFCMICIFSTMIEYQLP